MALNRETRALRRVNQPQGFDCPGCAWPDPRHASSFEFCENGAKAVAWEATRRRADLDFFAAHTVGELWNWTDFALEDAGRLTHPMVYDAATDRYVPISWEDAFTRIGAELRKLPDPNMAEFYTSGRTSNEAAFLYQVFVREFGTNNFPDCSNMCHEATSVGLPDSIGVGKGTVTLEDFDHADVVFCMGHNPGTNHPRMLSTLRDAFVADYNVIRDAIEKVFPAFADFNERVREPGGFRLYIAASERKWLTPNGKANFIVFAGLDCDGRASEADALMLATIRSHDQYNTTIYGFNDRYRGITGRRDVIFMHKDDLTARGLSHGDLVDVEAIAPAGDSGKTRVLHNLTAVEFEIARNSAAAYYPEANSLVALQNFDMRSRTPAYKSIPVRVRKAVSRHKRKASGASCGSRTCLKRTRPSALKNKKPRLEGGGVFSELATGASACVAPRSPIVAARHWLAGLPLTEGAARAAQAAIPIQ